MWRMWEKIHPKRGFKETRAYTHWRKAILERRVLNGFFCSLQFKAAQCDSHQRIKLRMWEKIRTQFMFENTSAHSHGRKALQVWRVWKGFFHSEQFKEPQCYS